MGAWKDDSTTSAFIPSIGSIKTQRKKHSPLKLVLESGRKHQIRVQAANAGFPIVGDSKYGLEEDKKKAFRLRAVALILCHPETKKEMVFTSAH